VEAEVAAETAPAEEVQPPAAEAPAVAEALETTGLPTEAPAEAGAKPEIGKEKAPAWEDEEDKELDEEQQRRKEQRKKTRRQESLVYDEESGTLIRRATRKESRRQQDWEEGTEW